MKDLTFDEFPSSSFDDWMQLVRKELGAQEFDSIVWKNENGFEVVPYLTESVFSSELDFPKHQSLCQQVDGDDPVHVNATLLNCLRGGADAISIGLKIDSYRQLKNVLENIQIELCKVFRQVYNRVFCQHRKQPDCSQDQVITIHEFSGKAGVIKVGIL